jgi:tyrosine ammonia-lyase
MKQDSLAPTALSANLPTYHSFQLPEQVEPGAPLSLSMNATVTTAAVEAVADGQAVSLAASVKLRCRDSERLAATHPGANLIASQATGLGELCTPREGRAILFARLRVLALGYSGARLELQQLMAQWLSVGPLAPAFPLHGAGSELSPLAHLALALTGDGECFLDGQLYPAALAARQYSLPLLQPTGRDAQALVNGASVMTALASLNDRLAHRLLKRVATLGAFCAELVQANASSFHTQVGRVRPHPGLAFALDEIQAALRGSPAIRPLSHTPSSDPDPVRCLPQILGAAWDVLAFHRQIVEREINSVTDNAIFDPTAGEIIDAANSHGQHVALAADALANAMVQVALLVEQQIALLADPHRHGAELAASLAGAAATARAAVAEMRTLATPVACQGLTSPGTLAARRSGQLLDRFSELLALAAIVITQVYEARVRQGLLVSTAAVQCFTEIRRHARSPQQDRPLREDIRALATWFRSQ